MKKRVTAKAVRFDPKFNDHADQLRSHGLRGDHDSKIYEGYVNDYDIFKYMTNSPEWTDYWKFYA